MSTIDMPYGNGTMELDADSLNIISVVTANKPDLPVQKPADVVRQALETPVESPALSQIVKSGEHICILVPDITRLWQSPAVSVPIVVEQLNKCGIPDEDIVILCACGTHRPMTQDEHLRLLGSDIVKRLKIVDHHCLEKDSLKFLGQTRRGTPVYFNKIAVNADKLISICGVVYHFLAGFGGGGKMLLPGISADQTIQANHKHALSDGFGKGINPNVRCGNISESNPFHADIVEAAEMLPPDFSLNVVANDKFNIIKAYAGNWKKAHLEACALVARMDGVQIPERAELVIASAGGMPKDINLYQAVKLLSNAIAAVKPGGTIVMLAQCPEGFGNEDCRRLICDFSDMSSRDNELRNRFSIGSFAGYFFSGEAENYNLVFVTDMDAELFATTKVHVTKTLKEALELARKFSGGKLNESSIVMPHGATTLPMMQP